MMKNSLEETLKTDSENNPLSSEQIEYFKNSKARDNKGRLLVCYHGTTAPKFNEFNPTKSKSQFGRYKFDDVNVTYFSTSEKSAIGYTEIGVKTDDNIYKCYVDLRNPYIVDNQTDADIHSWKTIKDLTIRKQQIAAFRRCWNKWSDTYPEDTDVPEINKDLKYCRVKLRKDSSSNYYNLWALNDNTLFGNERKLLTSYTLDELFDPIFYEDFRDAVIGNFDDEPDDYYQTIDEIIEAVLFMNKEEHTNHDGIIVKDIIDAGPKGSIFDSQGTDIVVFNGKGKIKLTSNKNPTNSNRIDESNSLL